MNPATDLHFGKTPLTPSHGDSLVDQSFQSLKSKEVRDSLSPTHDIKFRNSGGVAGGVLVPDTTGWNVQTSSEVSPDGRAFRTETLAKTDGVEKIPGGHSEFAGRNEQKSSASHQGDDKNYVKKAAESSKTHLQERVVIGDENSGRTEMKSSSVTSSSKVVSSSSQQVISSGDPEFDMQPRRLTQDQQYQNVLQAANNSSLHSERQHQFSRNERNERNETSSSVREDSQKYVDMDKASPEYQQHVQYLMSQPGAIVSNTVEYPKPGVKLITTVKKLPDGTTVKTKRYETEAGADNTSISQTMKQQQQQRMSSSSSTSQKTTEKRIQDSEDVFTRLSRTRESNVPSSPRNAPETPSTDDVYSRLQQSRGVNEQKFSDSIDQRSNQIYRDSPQHPGSRNAPIRRPSDLAENVEVISTTNRTVKKDLNQSVRSEKITSSDFIQNERDRYVLEQDSPSRRGPDGYPEVLAPITPGRHGRPQPDDYPSNGYPASEVIKESSTSKTSAKFSESRRYSTETVESYQHSEHENQDRDYPSNRRPIEEPKGRSPSSGRPTQDFSTNGFPSVRSNKPTQQYPSEKPSTQDENRATERVHVVHTDRPSPTNVQQSDSTTTRSNYSTNETRRHVTSSKEDFSTHGFPSVRAGTPTGDSPRRPSGQEPPVHQVRKPPSDGFSTHGFPSVRTDSPTQDSPRRPSGHEPTNKNRRPTTEDFSTHGFPSVKPGRSTPTQPHSPQYENSPRVDRDDTVTVTSDRSNSITYEKRIDAAHQAFARSLRCASPVESIRRDSISDRQTPRSSVGSIRNSYSPSKRDGRSPSHDSVTNSESSRISSATVTKTHRPTEVRRVSGPKSPIGKSAPSHVSNETIDLSLTRKITAKPSPEKTTGRPNTVKEEPAILVEPILRKKIFGATENFLASEGVIEKPLLKKEQYYQLGLSDATLPSSRSKARHQLGTTPNTSRRPHDTEEELNKLLDTATKHINNNTHPSSATTPTTRSAKNQDTKPTKPQTLYSKKPTTKPEGYITRNQANEISEKHNQTTNKHVSYPHYIPSAPKADRSPSDRPTTNNLSSPAPSTTTSTTPHNAPKSPKDKVKPPITSPTTTKPLSSPTKVDNSTSRFTKTVNVENAINRDTITKTKRQPKQKPESESEPLAEPEDLDEGYVPDRKGRRKPNLSHPTSDDEGFEPDSPRAGSPTSDFEYRRPEQVETYDEEDSVIRKTHRTDKRTVTNDFLTTERGVNKVRSTEEPEKPRDRHGREPEGMTDRHPRYPEQDDGKPSNSVKKPHEEEPKRPLRRPKDSDTNNDTSKQPSSTEIVPKGQKRQPSPYGDEPGKRSPTKPNLPEEENRRPTQSTRLDDKPSKITDSLKFRGTKPPLERSETFEERCRQILGMETETIVDRTKKTQEFIETERTAVDSKRKPTDRSPSPEKKQPSDTVSIEDCDDDDSDTPRKYPTGKTSTTTTTIKTAPRDISPSKREPQSKPKDKITGDHPRDRSPMHKGTRPTDTDKSTTKVTITRITDDRSTSPNRKMPKGKMPHEVDGTRPRGTSPSEKPGRIDEFTTVKKTTKIVDESDEFTHSKPVSRKRSPQGTKPTKPKPLEDSDTDRRSPSPQPRFESPTDMSPRDKSPSFKPARGTKVTDETTISSSEITNVTDSVIEDRYPSYTPKSYPRDHSPSDTDKYPSKKPLHETSPSNESPRDKSPFRKPVRGTSPTDGSPGEKSPRKPIRGTSPSDEFPRDKSPSFKPVRGTKQTDETLISSTKNTNVTDSVIEDRYPSYTPKSYPRDHSPSDTDKYPSKKPLHETSPSNESPRDKSPFRKPVRGTSPTDGSPGEKSPRKPIRGTSPSDESPRDKSPSFKPVRGTKQTDETLISSTKNTNVTDSVIEDRYSSYTPKSYARDHSPSDTDKYPSKKPLRETSPTNESPGEKSPFRKPVRGTSPTDGSPGEKSPRKPIRGTSPSDESPRDKSPSFKPVRGTKQTDETLISSIKNTNVTDSVIEDRYSSYTPKSYPRDHSPSDTDKYPSKKPLRETSPTNESPFRKPVHETSPTGESPRDKSPFRKPVRGTSPTNESPREKSPFIKPVRGKSPTGETVISSTTTTRSTTRDGTIKDCYPSDKQKPQPRPTEDEEVVIKTSKSTKKTSAQEILDEVFEASRPRDRSPQQKPYGSRPDSRDGSFISRPREQSPSKPYDEYPNDELTIEETEELVTKRTTKSISDKTTAEEITDRSPSSRPRDYPRDRSPTEKFSRPVTKETEEFKRTTKINRDTVLDKEITGRPSHPRHYPSDRSPVDDLTRPKTKEITQTHKTDKKTVVNEFLDTERGVTKPQRPVDDKPLDRKSPERLTSPQKDYPYTKPQRPTTDELTITETTRNTNTVNKVNELVSSTRPRDRSPNEKPIRSPRIITTETTTEYGIRERPRSQSPTEKSQKPLNFEEIDETIVQKTTKVTEDVDVEKTSRRRRPTSKEDQPRVQSPEKIKGTRPSLENEDSPRDKSKYPSKPSDRSPSPHSKYPREQRPTPDKENVPTRGPLESPDSEKPRRYPFTEEETMTIQINEQVSRTLRNEEDIYFRHHPRDRSPSEKPRDSRPLSNEYSPKDHPRGSSPSKKPQGREPIDEVYEESVIKTANKTRRDQKFLEEERIRLQSKYPEDHPRDKSPSEKPRDSRPLSNEYSPKDHPRGSSPSKKPQGREPIDGVYEESVIKTTNKTRRDQKVLEEERIRLQSKYPEDHPRDKSPSKPKNTRPFKETVVEREINQTTTIDDRTPKGPRGTSPTQRSSPSPSVYARDRSPNDKLRRVDNETEIERITVESTIIEDRTFKSPRGTSPSKKPELRDYPRDKSPVDEYGKPRFEETTVQNRYPKIPRESSPLGKKAPRDYPRDRSPTDEPRKARLDEETTTVRRTTAEERKLKSPRGSSPLDKPRGSDYPRDRSPTDENRKPKFYDETVGQKTMPKSSRGISPSEKPAPKDYPRDKSPNDKPRKPKLGEETVVETTIVKKTTIGDRKPKSPRGHSPSEKPRGRSPNEKPAGPRKDSPEKPRGRDYPRDVSPSDKTRKTILDDETVRHRTTKTITVEDRSPKSPRRVSPSKEPGKRDYPREKSPTDKYRKQRPSHETIEESSTLVKKTKDRKTVEEITHQYDDHHPRDTSPIRKPKGSKPGDDTIVYKTVKTTTVEDRSPENPRETSPKKTSPRANSPSQKPTSVYDRPPQESPRKTSSSEKPSRTQPTVREYEKTVVKNTSKLSKDRMTSEKVIVQESPRGKSPSKKPKQSPSSDEETDDETTETVIAVYTIEGEMVKNHPRDLSPSGKPRSHPKKQPEEEYPNTSRSNGPARPRGTSPSEKPKYHEPTDEEIEEREYYSRRSTEKKTLEEIRIEEEAFENRYPKERTTRPRESSPLEEPRSREPTNESKNRYPGDRPRDQYPSERPVRPHLQDTSPTKPTGKDVDSKRPEDLPRERIPLEKPGVKSYPRDRSPTDKTSRSRPSKEEVTKNRSLTTRKETDYEKRYPKSHPGDQSPNEKPSTLRRPSKSSTTSTTTTTRNRSTLDEQDITRTHRSRAQPSPRDKIPLKTSPITSPRTQPVKEARTPAELPSPGRKPKSTFGVTTTISSVTKVQATRPKPNSVVEKKLSKLPIESRPTARPTEKIISPSISPDSSPSRPASEVEIESPYRSPDMSPTRKSSPSPTRSVKLEDITSTVKTTKKTTVLIDNSKPKVTHVTTAKFQVTPPASPTKVTTSPNTKLSPSSKKPSSKVPTSKPVTSGFRTDVKTTKKVTKEVATDSERDSEIPSDAEEVDKPLSQKPSTRKLPVTERKESAPVHRVTKVNKDVQMSRSTSENIIKTPITKRPVKHEPLEPITQHEPTSPTVGDRSSPKTERRPSKHLSTKTINLTTFDKVINSQDMENVIIDIQHAKSSREQSPNKIVPTPVSVDMYTGKPRYPDVVQEPEDEPKKKPTVKNIPIFEEETNDFVGCQITEVSEDSHDHNTIRTRTTKLIERESSPRRQTPTIVTGDNVDNECLLSVHDKVTKFINTAEEVSKPKTSAPFRRDVPEEENMPEDDECLLTVDEKVSKFLRTADNVTKEIITSKPLRVERPSIEDLDEDLRTDECILSVSEKVNKFITKAEKLAPSAPQRSPELVARIERQISRPTDDMESECEENQTPVRKFKPTSPLVERKETKYTERQIDILSRPSVWDKKPKPDLKLDDIFGYKPEGEPEPVKRVPGEKVPTKTLPDDGKSKPSVKATISKRKELFENSVSTNKSTVITKESSPEMRSSRPTKPTSQKPSVEPDSRYPNEFTPQYVDGYTHHETDDEVHEDVYGSSKTRRIHETSSRETTAVYRSPERSPTRKSSQPDSQTPTRSSQPEDNTPTRRYSEDHSPRYPTRGQAQTDHYAETRETSEHTTRRRSSTQEYPEHRTPNNGSPSSLRKQPVKEPEDYTSSSRRDKINKHHTTRTVPRSPKDSPLNPTSFLDDDEEMDHSPARSTSTVSSHRQTTHRTTSTRLTEDITSKRPRRPSGNEPSTPTSAGRTPRSRAVPETVAARRNIFEKSPGNISPMPGNNRRPSYMEPTKSSLEHRKDSLEITKTNFSRKSSIEEEYYEPSPRTSVKFGVGLKHKEEPKPKRKLSSSDIPNIEDVFELDLLEEMLNIVTLYEQRRRIRAQIRVVKKLLETKTKEEVSRMTKISTIRKTSSSSVRESPTPKRETPTRTERYQPSDDIDSESIVESHVEEHEEIIRERSISPKTKTSRIVTKVTEVRKIAEPTTPKRAPQKKDEPKDSKPIWATKNILKKPSENEKVTRALSAKKSTSTSSSSMSRTQQTHRQRVTTDDDCVTSSYGIGPTDEDGRPLFGIRALKKKATTNNNAQPSETTKVTGTVITEKYYSENGAEPVGERKVTVYSTNPEDLVDMETQYDRRDSETVKREKLLKDGVTTVTKVQKIGKYKPGEAPLTDDTEFTTTTSKMVRRGSVKEMSEKFIRKESSSSVTEKSSGYPKAGLILRTRTNSGATADVADQYEVRAKSTEYDYDSEDDVEIRTSRKHSKVVTESDDETEIRRKVNTRSFLNSGGSKVTGIDDVLERMKNADNVEVDGDTLEDREARSLLNKFLGASVLMTGMESMIPQKELRKTRVGADNKQEVKTTRVTKTIKAGTTGGSSSSPVARETCDFEEIWDEEILKQLLEKSTSYEERRSIRARLRQLMAEREACAELKAGPKAELNETKVQKSTQGADDESSGSEYEEIIEEYTASEDEDESTPTLKKEELEEDNKNAKQITEEIKKTTITKKQEPKSTDTKKTVVVETTTVIEEDATPLCVEEKVNEDKDGDSDSASGSKGESLLIPLLQGLLHKNMPQARSSSGSSSKIATVSAATSNQNSNNLKSSLKANNKNFSSTSNSNNKNSSGDSGLSSEVSKNSSLGQKQSGSSLRVPAPQQIEDSGTESGEDLRLIAAGIRDSMQIEGIDSDMSLIKEVTNALNKLESSLKEGKDLALDNSKKSTLLALVERLQTGLTAPEKLSSAVGEQDFPDETSSPEADNHRSNRQRFAKRKNRNNRHTVGVSKEELADARRYIEEMVMMENLSNCTTPECNAATTPPELFAIQKQHSTGAILSSRETQETSASLFRPNQFVPNNLKHSTEAGSAHPDVQLRQKKATPGPGQRQSTGDMDSIKVPTSESNNGKRPLSDSFDSYTAQNSRVTFSDPKSQNCNSVQERNQYNRSFHSDDKPSTVGRLSPDSSRMNRFNNKKQLMKRANTIDIPKTHRYNPEFDTDSDFEDKNALNSKGLRGTVQVTVKRKPRQVVPNFEPKTENDHKFLAFIQKQSTTTGLGWNSSKSVSNWTNKFGNIKNAFESGASFPNSNVSKTSGPSTSSAKNFWKQSEEKNPPKISTNVLTSALKAKERNEKRGEVVVPKPIHLNKFSHNPQSAFRPVDTSPETIHMQFKPISMERPENVVNSLSPTKAYNSVRRQAMESPNYAQSSPTKSWIKKNTATNSPITLPWTVKPPENNVLKIAATKFASQSPVQRHQSFKQQEKRPSLPNAAYPYHYQDEAYSQHSTVSNSQPTSYAEYTPKPRIFRESSLTNPQAEPLILSPNKPAYSPHSLQPFEYYTADLNQHAPQTDMTDDDIDDMESMTEYRVEAKVMGKPMSQQAVTVGKRTAHMSDDEDFGKNSRAAKSLLSVMKNIGNGNVDRAPKKAERKPASLACKSPNGSAYQAPIVEPLFPEVTKFEANRDPEYIGPQQKHAEQTVGYQKNPVYVPLEDYQHKEPPVAPPRGRKVSQEKNKGSAYVPEERPNVYQSARRDAPNSLPIQAGPTSPPSYLYSSSGRTPESNNRRGQNLHDGMKMQNLPSPRKPYSEPNTPSDYSVSNETYFNQYDKMQNSYPESQPPVILPQIPLETSYTKVYDQPRDVASFYQPPTENVHPIGYTQPSMYVSPEYHQKPEIPQQYYQPSKVQHSPLPQGFAPQQIYQARAEVAPEYYQSPKIQQTPTALAFTPQQTYQPRVEVPPEYYPSAKAQYAGPPQGHETQSKVPVAYYQSPQPPIYAPQYSDVPVQYNQSPKVPHSPHPDFSVPHNQVQKVQQEPSPMQYQQSPKVPPSQPFSPQQIYVPPIIPQSPQVAPIHPYQSQQPTNQTSPSHKNQQSSQPKSPPYQSKAPLIQPKPQVPPKNEVVLQSSKSQHSMSTYRQQQTQNIVTATRNIEPQIPNAAVLCKQASLEGRKRVQSQSQKYEQVEEIRRKSLGNALEITSVEREAREQKAAAIKQDMYSVQQDVYSQQKSILRKTEVHQQETKVAYKSSAPDDTPDIVKSSLKKDDIPILKKFGPPQRHCYIPNAYQNPLMKSETTVLTPKTVSRKFSDPAVTRGPVIVEIPSTPQPDSQDEIPRNIVFNNISAFSSMSRKQAESSREYTSQQVRPNKLSKCDSWHQICQLQSIPKPPSPKFNTSGSALRRSKSGHTLALPKLYEASYDRAEISEKQKTVEAYFGGQKSPNSLSRNSSQTNLAEESNYVSVKKSSINRIKTSEKTSISRQEPSSGLSRSHTMPQIANVNLLDESNVEDAFEQLMNGLSTTTTEKTETKNEDGGIVTTTTKVTTRTISGTTKPVSPFAKFQQLDKQSSLQSPKSPLTPTTPGGSSSTPIFRFTDPALNARAATFKEQLLQWCQSKTQEYENVQITNFSASWTDGLAFCALIHHFLPDAFDYSKLNPKQRRYNFELAFRVADEKAGIAPLLDVEDMVVMKRPDWKCVFTYVQSIYRRFRNCQ